MESNLLESVSGDAIARDWELPELPSGMQITGESVRGGNLIGADSDFLIGAQLVVNS